MGEEGRPSPPRGPGGLLQVITFCPDGTQETCRVNLGTLLSWEVRTFRSPELQDLKFSDHENFEI